MSGVCKFSFPSSKVAELSSSVCQDVTARHAEGGVDSLCLPRPQEIHGFAWMPNIDCLRMPFLVRSEKAKAGAGDLCSAGALLKVPGHDNAHLRQFCRQQFGALWYANVAANQIGQQALL